MLVKVTVGVTVKVAVGVSVGVIVAVSTGVAVGVSVGVCVGVTVGVSVGVLVAVSCGVAVGVIVGVTVGVSVGVAVGVAAGTLAPSAERAPRPPNVLLRVASINALRLRSDTLARLSVSYQLPPRNPAPSPFARGHPMLSALPPALSTPSP